MAISEAKRAADLRWQRKNTHNFTLKMPNREADALRAACAAEGITVHSVLLRAAREMIARHAAEARAGASASSGESIQPGAGGVEPES